MAPFAELLWMRTGENEEKAGNTVKNGQCAFTLPWVAHESPRKWETPGSTARR